MIVFNVLSVFMFQDLEAKDLIKLERLSVFFPACVCRMIFLYHKIYWYFWRTRFQKLDENFVFTN